MKYLYNFHTFHHITLTPLPIHTLSPSRSPLLELQEYFAKDLEQVDRIIVERCYSDVDLVTELSSHLIQAGGKRIRPLLTMLAYEISSQNPTPHQRQQAIHLGAAIEFIHSATLLHDDVIDKSNIRRGKLTANRVWGDGASILVGDFLFAQAFRLILNAENRNILDVLAKATALIAEGEVFQLGTIHNLDMTFQDCERIMKHKTASLFSAACEVGAMVASAPPKIVQAIADYAFNLGLIFQVSDDVLDYIGNSEKRGKRIGEDFYEKKVTLPVLFAYQQGKEKTFWEKHFHISDSLEPEHPKDFEKAVHLIKETQALLKCQDVAKTYSGNARQALEKLLDFPLKHHLSDLLDYCMVRTV